MPNPGENPNGTIPGYIDPITNQIIPRSSGSVTAFNSPTSISDSSVNIPKPSSIAFDSIIGKTAAEQNAIQYAKAQAAEVSSQGLSKDEYESRKQNAYQKGLIASGFAPTTDNNIVKIPSNLYGAGLFGPTGEVTDKAVEQFNSFLNPAKGPAEVPTPLQDPLPSSIGPGSSFDARVRSEEHTSELQSHVNLVCRLLLEKKKK